MIIRLGDWDEAGQEADIITAVVTSMFMGDYPKLANSMGSELFTRNGWFHDPVEVLRPYWDWLSMQMKRSWSEVFDMNLMSFSFEPRSKPHNFIPRNSFTTQAEGYLRMHGNDTARRNSDEAK